jgi:hypothetical protein
MILIMPYTITSNNNQIAIIDDSKKIVSTHKTIADAAKALEALTGTQVVEKVPKTYQRQKRVRQYSSFRYGNRKSA